MAYNLLLREIGLQKPFINKNCTINEPNVYFQDAFIDLDNKFLIMTWTWCMSGEQWILGFIWPKKIIVTQYQPRAMIFVLTWYNLISLISHCLISWGNKELGWNIVSICLKYWDQYFGFGFVSISLSIFSVSRGNPLVRW